MMAGWHGVSWQKENMLFVSAPDNPRARTCVRVHASTPPHTPPPATTTTMTTTTILPPSGQSDLYPDAPMVKGIWNTHAPLLDVVHIDGVDHVMVW